MKKFIIGLSIFIAGAVALDQLLALFLRSERPVDYASFLDAKQAYFSNTSNYDLLVFGDSHVADALDPRLLEELSQFSTYNLGVYHASPMESYYLVSAALKKNPNPKIVVFGTNPVMFRRKLKMGKYTPLIIRGDTYNYLSLIFTSEDGLNLNTLSVSAQEKYLLPYVLKHFLGKPYHPTREVKSVYNGFLEFYNHAEGAVWDGGSAEADELMTNAKQVEYFKKTIDAIQGTGAKIIVVNLPLWKEREEILRKDGDLSGFENLIEAICIEKGVVLINKNHNLARDVLVQDDFLNAEHLNMNGATKFTSVFFSAMNNEISF